MMSRRRLAWVAAAVLGLVLIALGVLVYGKARVPGVADAEKTLPRLQRDLQSPDPETRSFAIMWLAEPRHGEWKSQLGPAMYALKTDPCRDVRLMAATMLESALGRPRHFSEQERLAFLSALLKAMTEDPMPEVREFASDSLPLPHERGESAAFRDQVNRLARPYLEKAVKDGDPYVREKARWALDGLGEARGK